MALVTRDHPKLTMEGARAILSAATARAGSLGLRLALAVVDDGGHLIVFERMDGTKPSSVEIAITKARAAALRRAATGPYMAGENPSTFISFGLALASHAQQTPIRGGIPLLVDGEAVGAIGVSGGSEEQDLDVALAGSAALKDT
jgi:glc operon protein GlcG